MSATVACPVAGCERKRKPVYLMCRPCWSTVPRNLQAEIYDSWRAYQREDTDEGWARYTVASNRALALAAEARAAKAARP